MTANLHLKPILDAYIAQTAPGFAIMVNAPWGAGKTYAVSQWLKEKEHCYVSLFGVSSIEAIDQALFNALLELQDIKISPSFTKAVEGITYKFVGVAIDVTGFHRKQLLKTLPQLIVFDDLERAQMSPSTLLAAINRFVEQEGKQVILIANEAELDENNVYYRRWREKVVGRTLTLEPEIDAALKAILVALPASNGREILVERQKLVREVFDRCKIPNLRLLRQSCSELASFLDRLPEQFRDQIRVLPRGC